MSLIQVLNVRYINSNPCSAVERFRFEITMECTAQLEAKEVEWIMTYIGSAQNNAYDQVLDTVEVETLMAKMQFVFDGPAPNLFLVPKEDQLDNSAVVLSAKYKGREFCRVGYYMRHEYPVEFVNSLRPVGQDGLVSLAEPELPCGEKLNLQFLQRMVDCENPRVTHYLIDWDAPNDQLVPPLASAEEVPDDDDLIEDEDEEDDDQDDEEEDLEMDMEDNPNKNEAQGVIEAESKQSMTYE